jgi:hypothetical protein
MQRLAGFGIDDLTRARPLIQAMHASKSDHRQNC